MCYKANWKGQLITNQPTIVGIETGFYSIDHYGCWHEVEIADGYIWMIGEYP